MHNVKIISVAIVVLGTWVTSSDVFAHASILSKDTLDAYSGRNYMEGSSATFSLHLAHGCSTDTATFATRHASIVFPNATDLTGIAYTEDHDGNRFAGNAVMGIKPRVDSDWKKIKVKTGEVPTFENHGANSTDVRGIHWKGGHVPNEMYENLEVKASFPKLDGCVSKLRVYMPAVQYCENGDILTWMRDATPSFPDAGGGSAPYIDIVRNMDANPLPDSCGGTGEQAEAYPSVEDVEMYLPIKHKSRKHGGKHDDDD
jgi:uncharacterized protein YcnI